MVHPFRWDLAHCHPRFLRSSVQYRDRPHLSAIFPLRPLSRRGFHLVDQNPRNDSKGLVLHDIVGAGRPCGKKILQELSVDSYEQTTLPQASPLLETTGSPGPSGAFFLDDHRVSGDCQLGS
jgi:hypothetical protein